LEGVAEDECVEGDPVAKGVLEVLFEEDAACGEVRGPGGEGGAMEGGRAGEVEEEEFDGLAFGVEGFALVRVLVFGDGAFADVDAVGPGGHEPCVERSEGVAVLHVAEVEELAVAFDAEAVMRDDGGALVGACVESGEDGACAAAEEAAGFDDAASAGELGGDVVERVDLGAGEHGGVIEWSREAGGGGRGGSGERARGGGGGWGRWWRGHGRGSLRRRAVARWAPARSLRMRKPAEWA